MCGIEFLRIRNSGFHLSVVEDVENRFGNGMDVVKWSLNVVSCFRVPLRLSIYFVDHLGSLLWMFNMGTGIFLPNKKMKIETGSALNESSHFCNIDVKANIKSNCAGIKTVLKAALFFTFTFANVRVSCIKNAKSNQTMTIKCTRRRIIETTTSCMS